MCGCTEVICVNCVMDSSDPSITFDSYGVCDHCNTFFRETKPKWDILRSGSDALAELAKKIKQTAKNREFDCIIGMSGGVDSSFLVYIATCVMGLRPLVFHVDAGWNSQIAVNNIEKMVDHLDLDLYTEVIDWEEMKDVQLSYFKSGLSNIDTPQDHAFFATMYRFAAVHGVKSILTGSNFSTECVRNPVQWMYYQSDSIQLRDVQRKFGTIPLKKFPTTSILWHKIWLPYVKGVSVYHPLNYVLYDKEEAKAFLASKFGWQPYPQKHFESRFTRFYESYWLYERFGYDVRRVQYSSLILTGQMERHEAIESLKTKPYDPLGIKKDINFIANKLEVSVDDLNEYFNLPKKSYREYRNSSLIYKIGSFGMKKLGLGFGLKR